MQVIRESVLDCPPDRVWEEVRKTDLLGEVASPLVRFSPADGDTLPEVWRPHVTLRLRLYAFSFVPLGCHSIFIEAVDEAAREIRTREVDTLCRRWDHVISVHEAGPGRTRYRDEVLIDAGKLTLFVWLFASLFFRHRHRRWAVVARRIATRAGTAGQLP